MERQTFYAEIRNEREDNLPISTHCEFCNIVGGYSVVVKPGETSPVWPITKEGALAYFNSRMVPRTVKRHDGSSFFVFTLVSK